MLDAVNVWHRKDSGSGCFVFTSSGGVYAENAGGTVSEDSEVKTDVQDVKRKPGIVDAGVFNLKLVLERVPKIGTLEFRLYARLPNRIFEIDIWVLLRIGSLEELYLLGKSDPSGAKTYKNIAYHTILLKSYQD